MAMTTDPYPRTEWRLPFAELVAAIRRTDDPMFAFEVVQHLARLTGMAPRVEPDDPVAALQAAGWAYIEALRDAAEDCDRAALAREAAKFVARLSEVVRGWAGADAREYMASSDWAHRG